MFCHAKNHEFFGEGGDQIEDEKGWVERVREALLGDD